MEERFSPEMVINHYITNNNITIDDIGVAPIVVASWGRQVIHSMAEKFGAEPSHITFLIVSILLSNVLIYFFIKIAKKSTVINHPK